MTVNVITVGLDRYTMEPTWNIAPAADSRVKVEQLLAEHGAEPEDWTPRADIAHIATVLGEWSGSIEDSHLIYWVGHGEHSDDGYRLALADSKDPLTGLNALTSSQLAEALRNQTRQRQLNGCEDNWVLLMLDTCGSGQGAWELWKSFKEPPRNVGVIAAAEEGAAYVGRLPAVLEQLLDGFNGNETVGISLRELMRRLEDHLEGDNQAKRVHHAFGLSAILPHRSDTPPAVQAAVDIYRELRGLLAAASPEVRDHFYAKAQGSEIGELAWHFTGRERERREVSAWLRDAPGEMFVVSGVAGSGKSALLGMLLASSDDAVTEALAKTGYGRIADDLRPTGVEFDAVVHLSGRTHAETVATLSTALALDSGEDVEELLDALRSREGGRLTILVDALDESRDPLTIAASLRRLAALPGVRLLVGTRQSTHEDPDHPIPPDSAILDALAAGRVIKLQQDPDAVRSYVAARLRSGLPVVSGQRATDLAVTIAAYPQPFLFARLAVREIIAEPALVDNYEQLARVLSSGHSGIFGHAVTRLARTAPEVEALLHVLTYARGNGFPRTGGIWAIAASELTEASIDDRHVRQTLQLAAPFIMQDSEFGHTVYRLAHRTFAEWYQRSDAQ